MKTKHLYIFILLGAFCHSAFGQVELLRDGSLPYDTTTTSALIEFGGDRTDNSNALNRNFLQKLLFGGHIDNDLKESVAEGFDGNNFYRGMMNPTLSFTLFPDSAKYGYLFSYRYTNISDVGFSDDFFNLAFYGNQGFGANSANLTRSYYKQSTYQSLSFGLVEKHSGSFLSIGLYDGIDYSNYRFGPTYLFTDFENTGGETYADSVFFNTKFTDILESSNSYSPFKNGVGIGLSATYNFTASNQKFSVSVVDLGAMYWRDLAHRDTLGEFVFSGFEFTPGESGVVNNVVESLVDSIMPTSTNENKWILLPGNVRVNYVSGTNNRFFASARAIHYYGKEYYSELSADLNMKYGKSNFLWLSGGINGYGNYLLGLGTEFTIFHDGVFKIGSRQVLGLVDGSIPSMNLYFQYVHRL